MIHWLPWLKLYLLCVSFTAAFAAVMVMQVVGRAWTTSFHNVVLQQVQRFSLLSLSVTLLCAALRVPFRPDADGIVLLSYSSVVSAILILMLSTALIGKVEGRR